MNILHLNNLYMLRRCMQAAILFKILTCQPTWYIRGVVPGLPERPEIVRLRTMSTVLALIISAHSPWNLIVFDLTLSRCIWHSIVRMKYYWRLWRHIAIVRCLHSSHVFANLVWSLVASLYVRPSCHCQRSTFVTWFWKSCLKLCSLLVCSSFMSCQRIVSFNNGCWLFVQASNMQYIWNSQNF